MRVLHLISSGGLYGAEAVILQLCQGLNQEQPGTGQIGAFAHAGQPAPALFDAAKAAGVPVHLVPCKGQIDFSVAGRLRDLVQSTGAELIHAHGYKADIYSFAAFRGKSRPAMVSTCHTWYDNDLAVRLYGAADRRVLRSFDEVVAVSAEVQQRLLGAGVASDRVHLVRNGVPWSEQAAAPRPLGNTGDRGGVRVGLVGRLAPEKGVDLFLRATATLKSRFPDARFVIAGDGPDRAGLEGLQAELGLRDYVHFCGRQADMQAFYESLDVLVSASRQEGLPMALLEGMSAGLPVVATRVGEVPQVVVQNETGLLVAPGEPDVLAEAVGRLLAEEALRRSFGAAGRRRIGVEFSAQRMTEDYRRVYRSALARLGRAARNTPRSEAP